MATTRTRAPKRGEKFKIIVSSVEEALATIQKQFGDNVQVLEVNQVGGKGLAKFLSSPQLEVIGQVVSPEQIEREKQRRAREAQSRRQQQQHTELPQPDPAATPALPDPEPEESDSQGAAGQTPQRPSRPVRPNRPGRPERPQPAAAPAQNRPTRPGRPNRPVRPGARPGQQPQQNTPAPSASPAGQAPANTRPAAPSPQPAAKPEPSAPDPRLREADTPLTPSGKETLEGLLKKARFDDDLIHRVAAHTDWERISKMQLNHGLSEVFTWLRSEFQKLEPRPIATRMAFMGTPGCGKTTALCKRMANDVFVHGKQIQVLKVEGDSPNPDDALRVLCDILGVELYRDPVDLDKVDPNGDLYVDVPGISLGEREQWSALGQRLDELYVETRVLVINAAYEKEAIKELLAVADTIGCTHQVFTHLDELANITKLWHFILNSKLTTLFFSYGQNVTSEFSNDILDYMTTRTFPSYLTS